MNRIHLLSDEVASQVAAGEVVERPASVVKELVENSIDAGAKQIEVLVRRGGISLIRVVDDGCGMNRDDALLSLERHATSKIRTGADLAALHTLGFRGEALPSIASVSRFRLCTREHDAEAGTEIQITGGKIDHVRDAGEAPGTQIEVRSLFFNLPARRKFLRTENTEMSHVEHQLALQAIGHPEIGFVFRTDQRLVFQIPATTSLHQRIRDLWGASLADELLEVPPMERDGVRIHGYVGRAGVSRSTRTQQLTFVNGRAVENSVLTHALREGYHTSLMKGQSPITFLFIELEPEAVDVNVHPAKREVRFREPSRVREAVVEAVRAALESDRERWSATFVAPEKPVEENAAAAESPSATQTALPLPMENLVIHDRVEPAPQTSSPTPAAPPPPLPEVRHTDGWVVTPEPPRAIPVGAPPPERYAPGTLRVAPPLSQTTFTGNASNPAGDAPSRSFRLLGVLGSLYVLMENEGGLVLVDQHAAHERILFEQLQRRIEEQGVPVQRLLVPVTLELGARDSDWVAQNLATLQKMGIGMEPFGAGTWKLDSLPQFVRLGDPLRLLREVIDELRTVSSSTSKLRLGEDVIAKTVCRAAVKANDILREPELIRLIEDLLRCDLPYCCPHGRPTMIQISYSELEKKFGRKV